MKLYIMLVHEPIVVDDTHVLEFDADRMIDNVKLRNGVYMTTSTADAVRLVIDADAFDAAHPDFHIVGKDVYSVVVNNRQIDTPRSIDVIECMHGNKRVYVVM